MKKKKKRLLQIRRSLGIRNKFFFSIYSATANASALHLQDPNPAPLRSAPNHPNPNPRRALGRVGADPNPNLTPKAWKLHLLHESLH